MNLLTWAVCECCFVIFHRQPKLYVGVFTAGTASIQRVVLYEKLPREYAFIGLSLWLIGLATILLVLCEYSKFRIKSNSYLSIRFDSKRAQLFEISEYLPSPISYLFNRMTPIFAP